MTTEIDKWIVATETVLWIMATEAVPRIMATETYTSITTTETYSVFHGNIFTCVAVDSREAHLCENIDADFFTHTYR